MNVALVHPTNWPQVRRGTERFVNEMAAFLVARGHSPTIITSHPRVAETTIRDGLVTEYHKALWQPWMARFGVLDFHVFPLTTLRRTCRRRFDVIHTFNFVDTLAATAARTWTRVPVLLHLNVIPPAVEYRRSISSGGMLLKRAIRYADEVLTISHAQQEYYQTRFGRTGIRIEAPVDVSKFPCGGKRDSSCPILLCASALEDRRKGGRLLMRAFNEVKRLKPHAVLVLCGHAGEALRTELMCLVEERWRDDVRFVNPSGDHDLAKLYAEASALILPSLWEAFPLVVLEALSSGTPVAGTQDGGIAQILAEPGVGCTFDPGPPNLAEPSNLPGLVRAILDVLGLSQRDETAARCREVANMFSWETLGPRYEELYSRLASATGRVQGMMN